MFEDYYGLKAYKRALLKNARNGWVPSAVQIRTVPARVSRMILGRQLETLVHVHYIKVQENRNEDS